MSGESSRKSKYLRILAFFVVLSLVVFSFLQRPQSLRLLSDLRDSNPTQLATTSGGGLATANNPSEMVSVLTGSNLSSKGDFDARSVPTVKSSDDSLSVGDNTSRSLPGETISAASEGRPVKKLELEWDQAMLKRFSKRRSLLQEKCQSYKGRIPPSMSKLRKDALLYSRKYNLLACITAKGGASTWKSHFLRMSGYTKYFRSAHKSSLKKRILASEVMSKSQFYRKTHQVNEDEKIFRVMSVRHPFSRLVSAYMDKFFNGSLHAPYKSKLDMYMPALTLMCKPINPRLKVAIPFSVFLRSILEENKRGTESMNRHWRPYSSNCKPCHISYEYIVKLETFEEDLRYLVLKLGIAEIDVTTRKNQSNQKKSLAYEAYYRDIPDDVIARVYSIYEQDFYLFDYDIPQFVKDALTNTGSRQKSM